MREIKFRAWDKVLKEMLYSDFEAYGFYSAEDPDRIEWHTETIFNYHAWTGDEEFVLMQYINIFDKNGTEIYEGDILNLKLKDYADDPDVLKFVVKDFPYDVAYLHSMDEFIKDNETFDYIEIIGNIYENPELLEVRP